MGPCVGVGTTTPILQVKDVVTPRPEEGRVFVHTVKKGSVTLGVTSVVMVHATEFFFPSLLTWINIDWTSFGA